MEDDPVRHDWHGLENRWTLTGRGSTPPSSESYLYISFMDLYNKPKGL